MKRLYRKKYDKKICGVCSGIAEYLNIDPTVIRIAWLVAVFCAGFGIIPYFIMALVMPDEDEVTQNQ